ncbi:MAG TPA: hypothetical protein VHV51_05770 [Polyangiaceae bacterium]|jgi:hypothetical protein|nr:hypothetical protein [Polyangiaceae bacterium]
MGREQSQFLACLLALAGSNACIGPAGGHHASGANGANGESASVALTPGPDGKALIWDGEGIGSKAQGWASCGKKDVPCKTTLASTPGVGHGGGTGLRFHAEGSDYLGSGWNWIGWYPQNGGSDISALKGLTFWFKLEAKSPADAPDPSSLIVSLTCSKGGKSTDSVAISKYDAKAFDGAWHQIVIPLADIEKGKGSEFDPKTAWQFNISSWSGDEKNFDVYLDDIGFTR